MEPAVEGVMIGNVRGFHGMFCAPRQNLMRWFAVCGRGHLVADDELDLNFGDGRFKAVWDGPSMPRTRPDARKNCEQAGGQFKHKAVSTVAGNLLTRPMSLLGAV